MTHLAIALFFSLIFIGVGFAAQLLISSNSAAILSALRGELPVPAEVAAREFKVTLRPRPALMAARLRRAGA